MMNLYDVIATVIVTGAGRVTADVISYKIEARDAADAEARLRFVLPDNVVVKAVRVKPTIPATVPQFKAAIEAVIATAEVA